MRVIEAFTVYPRNGMIQMKLSKLILAVVSASVVFGALASSASAGRLSFSANIMRATWARMDFSGGFGTVECEVTLEGSLQSRTFSKTAGRVIGALTRASVRSPCRRGDATILTETLPWQIQYNSFEGTLPNISGILTHVIGASFRLREPTFGITCLARSTAEALITLLLKRLASGALNLLTGGGVIFCINVTNITINGNSNTVNNGSGTVITVTLI